MALWQCLGEVTCAHVRCMSLARRDIIVSFSSSELLLLFTTWLQKGAQRYTGMVRLSPLHTPLPHPEQSSEGTALQCVPTLCWLPIVLDSQADNSTIGRVPGAASRAMNLQPRCKHIGIQSRASKKPQQHAIPRCFRRCYGAAACGHGRRVTLLTNPAP